MPLNKYDVNQPKYDETDEDIDTPLQDDDHFTNRPFSFLYFFVKKNMKYKSFFLMSIFF